MAGKRATLVVLIVAGLGLAVSAGALGYGEVAPYLLDASTDALRVAVLADGEQQPGLSLFARNMYLTDCLNAAQGLYGQLQPGEVMQPLYGQCADNAALIASSSPTQSQAWLVVAAMRAGLKDQAGFADAMQRSRDAGAHIDWIADRRIDLAFAHRDWLDDAVSAGLRHDIGQMLEDDASAVALARRYTLFASQRDAIVAAAEQAPNAQQAGFLNLVRQFQLGALK